MKEGKKVAMLPAKLVKEIECLDISDLIKSRALKAVYLILRMLSDEEKTLDLFTDVPRNYWMKVFGSHYERVIRPLLEAGIVRRLNSYSTIHKQCKRYGINPEMVNDELVSVSYKDEKQEKCNSVVCKGTRKVLRALKLDIKKATADVEQYLKSGAYLQKVKFDEEVMEAKNHRVHIRGYDGNWYQCYMSKEKALMEARLQNKSLIQDKRKIFIENKWVFKRNKQIAIRFSYLNCLERFANKEIYAEPTETNGRLNSNISTMPSLLLKDFSLEGESLIGLDLSNSQFVFLAAMIENGYFDKYIEAAQIRLQKSRFIAAKKNASKNVQNGLEGYLMVVNGGIEGIKEEMIEGRIGRIERKGKEASLRTYMCAKSGGKGQTKTPLKSLLSRDLQDFLVLSKSGKLYEEIWDRLGLNPMTGRAEAKQIMFEIFFSKHDARSTAKSQLKEVFPTLIEMIKLFKQEHGDNQFAIALQKKESEIFIGKILPELFRLGFKVLTKHDSVLCKRSDEGRVEAIMRQFLDVELGEYQLKPDYLD